jgi:Sec-independent protein translocase protein TatA
MPEMARKIGKMMADFRSATNEFKETWEREVNFEDEAKVLRDLDGPDTVDSSPDPVARENTILNTELEPETPKTIAPPLIKPVDPSAVQALQAAPIETEASERKEPAANANDKRNWL